MGLWAKEWGKKKKEKKGLLSRGRGRGGQSGAAIPPGTARVEGEAGWKGSPGSPRVFLRGDKLLWNGHPSLEVASLRY